MLSLAKLSVQPGMHPLSSLISPHARASITDNTWPVFASMSWALVMYLFRWYPETLASSLRSSMVYMYVFVILLRSGVCPGGFLSFYFSSVDGSANHLLNQLRGLGPLGFFPKLGDSQQINVHAF